MKERKALDELMYLIDELDKLRFLPCEECKGSEYFKLPDWHGRFGYTCKSKRCHYGNIIVDDKFRWEKLKEEIKRIKEEIKKGWLK